MLKYHTKAREKEFENLELENLYNQRYTREEVAHVKKIAWANKNLKRKYVFTCTEDRYVLDNQENKTEQVIEKNQALDTHTGNSVKIC